MLRNLFLALASFIFFSTIFITAYPKFTKAACTAGMPANLMIKPGTKEGTAMLSWSPAMDAHRYSLVYGFASNNYMFGALTIDGGKDTNYMVTHLDPGVKYYFRVWAMCSDDGPATASNEVSVVAPRKMMPVVQTVQVQGAVAPMPSPTPAASPSPSPSASPSPSPSPTP